MGLPKENNSIRHSLPLSFGLEISYFPASRLALTSGLELSVYNSVFTVPFFGEQRQRVHYLGIPLKADWVAWQAGRFSAWLGAGGKVGWKRSINWYLLVLSFLVFSDFRIHVEYLDKLKNEC